MLLLPAAAPNPTGAGCLFYYSLVGGSRSTDTFSEQQIQKKKKELNLPTLNRKTLTQCLFNKQANFKIRYFSFRDDVEAVLTHIAPTGKICLKDLVKNNAALP